MELLNIYQPTKAITMEEVNPQAGSARVGAEKSLGAKHSTQASKPKALSLRQTLRVLFAHRALWLLPLTVELLFAVGACLLSRFFYEVTTSQDFTHTLQILAGLVTATVLLKIWCVAGDLFMPRPVVLLALVPVSLACVVVALGLTLVKEPLDIRLSQPVKLIVAFPLLLFVLRAWFCLRAARFAPPLDKLRPSAAAPANRLATAIRNTLTHWCN